MKEAGFKKKFEQIGARVKLPKPVTERIIREVINRRGVPLATSGFTTRVVPVQPSFSIDVKNDRQGEYFELIVTDRDHIEIIDIEPKLRQLLLKVNGNPILAGHDERHLFTCAVPNELVDRTFSKPVTKVKQAMLALQPREVRDATKGIRRKNALKRQNKAYKRQGEWFFVPAPQFNPGILPILKKEPLSRGFGKNHMTEELCRRGGRDVWVSPLFASGGITEKEYQRHPRRDDKNAGWRMMKLDPEAYVRGRVWHPDHKTLVLDGWHRVYLNEEGKARGARLVRFLD